MAGKQTLTDAWIPRSKKSRSDEVSASEVLESCEEREPQTSSSTTDDLLADASTLDSTDHAADIRTLEAETGSSDYHGDDTPTSKQSDKCDADCCKAGYTGEPFQARNQGIILRTRKHQGRKVRQFSTDWYKIYPWLVLCVTTLKAFCYFCRYCFTNGLLLDHVDDAFVRVGFDNWKKARERFQKHTQSQPHKQAMMHFERLKQPSIDSQLHSQCKASQELHQKMLQVLISSIKYLVRQGLALRGHEDLEGNLMQLLLLRSEECPGLKQWIKEKKYLSGDIINEIIGIMSNQLLRKLLNEVREVALFSLIADEATDITNKEQLCVSVRWVDTAFTIHDSPVELINLPKTDAATIATVIRDCLTRFALPLSQCRGQAYDGASTMSGHISGVAARIEQVEPTAIYVHCLAHSTNLCLQAVGMQSLPIRQALDFTMEVSQLIRFSPKRTSLFESLQAQVSPGAPTLKPLCPTHWTVRTRAIEAIASNYEVLTKALTAIHESGRDEYALKAGGHLTTMERFSTYFGLQLSHLIFSATEQLSLTLQGQNTTIQEAVGSARLTVNFLEQQRKDEKFDRFYTRVTEESKELTSEPVLPRFKRMPRRYDQGSHPPHRFEDPKSYFRQQYFEALDIARGELERRFLQRRGMPVAAALESILIKACNGDGSVEDLPSEINLYSKEIDIPRLKIQLQMLPDLLRTYNEKNPSTPIKRVTSLRTLCDVICDLSSSRSLLNEVSHLLKIVLTIPVSSATAERTFSCLRRLKTFLRSSMTQTRLNHVMLLHIHKERTDSLDLMHVSKEFISVNERRMLYFGRM